MRYALVEEHSRPPFAPKFMLRAFKSKPRTVEFPSIVERWSEFRLDPRREPFLREAMGVGTDSILYPHAAGFRLQMALLTHPAFPLPIWNALQIRNRLLSHHALAPNVPYVLSTSIGAHRFIEKGVEVDLETKLSRGDQCYWESVVTYFYRGQFGRSALNETQASSPDLSSVTVTANFRTPKAARWAFGSLTGDYNGIHLWDPYARRFGFPAAFMHPQRAIGLCLAQMRMDNARPQSLAVWVKGPVFYGAEVVLVGMGGPHERQFGLSLAGDPRQAIVGEWSHAT
jgi:hypothetical protein